MEFFDRRKGRVAAFCNTPFFSGAADRTRTGTELPPADFKSAVSTIPPQRHILDYSSTAAQNRQVGNGTQAVPSACRNSNCRGDHWSSADFAYAKSVAARRNDGYFPSKNPKIKDFWRTSDARPYNYNPKIDFFDSLREAGASAPASILCARHMWITKKKRCCHFGFFVL